MKTHHIRLLAGSLLLLTVLFAAFGYVNSAIHAASSIKILMYNGSTGTTSNQIAPRFQVVNTGTSAITLSTLKIRYYFTEDGTQNQSFWCDWSQAGSSNVNGTFVSLSSPVTNADHYLEIGFSSGAGNLAAGATLEIQTRFAKSDWSNYNQSNDYSFRANGSTFGEWDKIAGYLDGSLAWGSTPDGSSTGPTPTPTPTRGITPTPTSVATSTPTPTPGVTPTPGTTSDRYFPAGTSVDTMKSTATNMSKQQIKTLIEGQVNEHWSLIQSTFSFTTKEKAYAFFLGMATRESTLNGGLETGGGSAHSYGPLQAAETAFANADPSYMPETDVPEMTQYDFTPQNFYDVGISIHMGIRHLIHFAHSAQAAGYSGVELLRHALIGYNTGWVETSDQNWLHQYADEIGALGGWYLNNGHLYDNAFTWTSSSDVDRSNPWGWY